MMKIMCKRETMAAAFHKAALVAPVRSPKTILQSVKVVALHDSVEFWATDLEIGVRVSLDVKPEETGEAILPVQQFSAILAESAGEKVSLAATKNEISVNVGRSRYKLPVKNPNEFPEVLSFGEASFHKVRSAALKCALMRTEYATDVQTSRYSLGGVLLEMDADKITAVATDGRRLSKMSVVATSVGGHSTEGQQVLVPKESARMLGKMLGDGEAFVCAQKNSVIVSADGVVFYARRIEGTFPNWKGIVPERSEAVKITLHADSLYQAVKQASIVTDDESRGIVFKFSDGKLELRSKANAKGASEVELPIDYKGQPIRSVLDHEYVLEFLRTIKGEEAPCVLEVIDEKSAAVFRVSDDYAYVIMPLTDA